MEKYTFTKSGETAPLIINIILDFIQRNWEHRMNIVLMNAPKGKVLYHPLVKMLHKEDIVYMQADIYDAAKNNVNSIIQFGAHFLGVPGEEGSIWISLGDIVESDAVNNVIRIHKKFDEKTTWVLKVS
jgi:hypothetical protein